MKNKIKIWKRNHINTFLGIYYSIFGHEKYANLDNFLVAVELNDQNSNFKILRYALLET